MNTTVNKKTIALFAAGVIAVITVICAIVIFIRYPMVGGHFYDKHQYVYDLRGQEFSEKDFQKLTKRLPDSWILWDVDFQGNTYPSDIKELAVFSLTDEEAERIAYFPQLETLHAEGCENLPQLQRVQELLPGCKIFYNVEIGGKLYKQDTTHLELVDFSEADLERIDYLKHLQKVDTSRCYDYANLETLKQNHPEWNISYEVKIGQSAFPVTSTNIEAVGGTYDQLAGAFAFLSNLKKATITDPEASGVEMQRLREEFPNLKLDWKVTVFGTVTPCDVTELDVSNHIYYSTDDAEALAAYFPDLEKLIMSDCGIDDETMAAFREKMRPDYKVVWTVHFSPKCKARTDDIYFMPIKQGEYYFNDTHTPKLKYLEDLICLDVGHAPIKNIEFVTYLPHLKYLILAWTDVRDISPISCLKELIFLELDNTPSYHDYTPLLGLTALEDLNLSATYNDWTPIKEMTWLKHLWWNSRKDAYVIEAALKEVMPDCVMEFHATYSVGSGWRKLKNYYDMRDILGMYYMD